MKGFLHRGVCARGAAFRHLGAWRVYAFIKIMKSFLRRSVYVGRARKCVRYFRERAEEVSEKRIREKEPEIRHFGACSLMACIRFFQDDAGVSAQ